MLPRETKDAQNTLIVIFGAAVRPDGTPSGAMCNRVAAAVRYGAGITDPWYAPTGAVGRFPPSEARVMADLLRAAGVPEDRIVLEETATDTVSSVRAIRAIVPSIGATRVAVATSAYHLPRCVTLIWLAGMSVVACPPGRVPAARRRRTRWYWRLREMAALPYDAALIVALRLSRRL